MQLSLPAFHAFITVFQAYRLSREFLEFTSFNQLTDVEEEGHGGRGGALPPRRKQPLHPFVIVVLLLVVILVLFSILLVLLAAFVLHSTPHPRLCRWSRCRTTGPPCAPPSAEAVHGRGRHRAPTPRLAHVLRGHGGDASRAAGDSSQDLRPWDAARVVVPLHPRPKS